MSTRKDLDKTNKEHSSEHRCECFYCQSVMKTEQPDAGCSWIPRESSSYAIITKHTEDNIDLSFVCYATYAYHHLN